VQWSAEVADDYPAAIRVQTANQRGVLATLAARIAEFGANIENVSFEERDGTTTTITFILSVKGRHQLARIMRSMRTVPEVIKITRTRG
jgi:GTP pyrophosphokinase